MENDEYKEELTLEARETMRENAIGLIGVFLDEKIPFRLVLWNNNNWNKPLPDTILESFPLQLLLDIKDSTLEKSFLNYETGEVVLTVVFEGEVYTKNLEYDEIIGVLDLYGQPYILNNFKQEENKEEIYEILKEDLFSNSITIKDLISVLTSDGIPVESAKRSINLFTRKVKNEN